MAIRILSEKDDKVEIEGCPEPLTRAQAAAVEQAIGQAIDRLDIREIIQDSVADTLGGIKRRLRADDNGKVKHE